MKKFMKEFREFALKGNVMNLAVGIMIGAAFQGIVASLTENILSPIIGLVAGQNFDHLLLGFWGIELRYGAFITSVINFVITAFVIFLMVKFLNKIGEVCTKKDEPAKKEPTTKKCSFCITEIDIKATRCPNCTSVLG